MIHAVSRCREELAGGAGHRSACVVGIGAVGAALVLALSTSSVAFASNATSSIPAVTQFGFGAAIALACAFLVLGILSPAFLLRIEEEVTAGTAPATGARGRIAGVLKLVPPALLAGLAVIALIALPALGTLAFVAYSLVFLALPLWWSRRRIRRSIASGAPRPAAVPNTAGQSSALAGAMVAGVVRARYAVLAVLALVTVGAGFAAFEVGSKTEPEDFFPSGSDFIAGINNLQEHSTSLSPGGALIYAEGDIDDPRILTAMAAATETVSREGGDLFARTPDGELATPDSALDIARAAVAVEFAAAAVAEASGIAVTDADGDGFPDSQEQVAAVFVFAAASGIPADDVTFVYTAAEVAQLLARTDAGDWATVLDFPLQGFLGEDKVEIARATVEANADILREVATGAGLALSTSISGEAVAEQRSLDAITDAMVVSVPLAIVLCLLVAGLVMRSPKLAAVSVVPIRLVIVWLLGFMYLFDYDLNVTTATIAAISVGVGIDFSIHYAMRFREELARAGSRIEAIRRAATGTGTALMLSGGTSVIGFAFLALAPMPILAAYGLLTAVMIALSLLAALTVLPSLLFIVSREPVPLTAHAVEPGTVVADAG